MTKILLLSLPLGLIAWAAERTNINTDQEHLAVTADTSSAYGDPNVPAPMTRVPDNAQNMTVAGHLGAVRYAERGEQCGGDSADRWDREWEHHRGYADPGNYGHERGALASGEDAAGGPGHATTGLRRHSMEHTRTADQLAGGI